ncbi:MAG: BspA family leucine-rich repeat surface protein [Clostridiales bacterium]|nr:BspA family leucine-rich repeat surface protein [Clostridiales bacterium]
MQDSSILPGSAVDFSVSSQEEALSALDAMSFYYGYDSAEEVFSGSYIQNTGLFTVYHFSQTYNELEVAGHSMNVIVDDGGTVLNFAGNYESVGELSTEAKVSEQEALTSTGISSDDYMAALCIYFKDDAPYLSWEIVCGFYEYYVDASTGELLDEISLLSDAEEMDTSFANLESQSAWAYGQEGSSASAESFSVSYDSNSKNYYLIDNNRGIRIYETRMVSSVEDSFNAANLICAADVSLFDTSGIDAMYNVRRTYDFYDGVLNHTSMDGSGNAALYIGIHAEKDADGNSISDGAGGGAAPEIEVGYIFFYESTDTYDSSNCLMVVAHEFTHGVKGYLVGNSYSDEWGAMSEALSDIMGVLCCAWYNSETCDWQLENSRDFTDRNIASPSGKYISSYDQYSDSLEVHAASTPISHAAYLMNCQPDLDASYAIDDVQTLARLWYNALYLLDGYSDFSDLRVAVERVAKIMLDKGELTEKQYDGVWFAFEQSGIPAVSDVYYADEDTEIQVLVIDGNNGGSLIAYDHYSAVVISEDGNYVKKIDDIGDSLKAEDIVDNKKNHSAYYITLCDEYTENEYAFKMLYIPQTLVSQMYGLDVLNINAEIEVLTNFGSGRWITGVVQDEEGDPLAAVSVTLQNLDNLGQEVNAETDINGKYRVYLYYEAQEFALAFEKEGYENTSYTRTFSEDELSAVDQEESKTGVIENVTMNYERGTLSGSVYNAYDTTDKISDATVTATYIGNDSARFGIKSYMASSGSDGSFTMELPTGEYQLEFTAQGAVACEENVTVTIEKDKETEKDGLMQYGVYLCGYVYDDSGNPLEGVAVDAVSTENSANSSTTDENGYYLLLCYFSEYTITYSLEGHYSGESWITVTQNIRESAKLTEPYQMEDVTLTQIKLATESGNVMMSDSPDNIYYIPLRALDGKYTRGSIISITFLDTLENMPEDAWDVSEKRDGSVMAWVVLNEERSSFRKGYSDVLRYDMYIGGEGGVDANPDCSYLFYDYNLDSIEFNTCFYTGNVTNMCGMFDSCGSENALELDLSSFDTSNVTSMASMFAHCINVTKINVLSFDTSKVTTMNMMFYDCEDLTEIDVSGFVLSSAEDMKYMFMLCTSLTSKPFDGVDLTGIDADGIYSETRWG